MKVPNGKKKTLNQSNNMSMNFAATKEDQKRKNKIAANFNKK